MPLGKNCGRALLLMATLVSVNAGADSCSLSDKKAAVVEAVKNNIEFRINDADGMAAAAAQDKAQGYTLDTAQIITKPAPLSDAFAQQIADNILANVQDPAFVTKHSLKAPYAFRPDPNTADERNYLTMMFDHYGGASDNSTADAVIPVLISPKSDVSKFQDSLDDNHIVMVYVLKESHAADHSRRGYFLSGEFNSSVSIGDRCDRDSEQRPCGSFGGGSSTKKVGGF
jgi:hypothetical protein